MNTLAIILAVLAVLAVLGGLSGRRGGPSSRPGDDEESSNSLYIRERRDGPDA